MTLRALSHAQRSLGKQRSGRQSCRQHEQREWSKTVIGPARFGTVESPNRGVDCGRPTPSHFVTEIQEGRVWIDQQWTARVLVAAGAIGATPSVKASCMTTGDVAVNRALINENQDVAH